MSLIEALKKLDPSNDNHWTSEGIPRLDTVRILMGDQSVNRDRIESEAPGFNRTNSATYVPPEVQNLVQTQASEEIGGAEVTTEVTTEVTAPVEQIKVEVSDIVEEYTQEQLEQAQVELENMRIAIEKAQNEYQAAQKIVDKMIEYFHKENPKSNFAETMQGYLASQQRIREEQALKNQALKDAGFDLKTLKSLLPSVAPIDAAMARPSANSSRPRQI